MSRVSALLSRIAAACALLLVAALLAPVGPATAAPTAGELSYACALKSNGLLRAVSSLSECKRQRDQGDRQAGTPHRVHPALRLDAPGHRTPATARARRRP